MKTLKDFTPEIRLKIPQYINEAIDGIHNGKLYENFDLEKAKKAIYWNYQKCGLKNPVVLVAENLLEQQLMFNYLNCNIQRFNRLLWVLNNEFINFTISIKNKNYNISLSSYFILFFDFKNIKLGSQLHSQLHSQLNSQLDSQLRSQLHSQLDSQLYSQLDSQLHSQLDSQLDSQLHSQLNSQLDSQLGSQLGSQLDSQLLSQLRSQLGSQLGSQLDSQLGSQLGSQLLSQLDSQLLSQLGSQLGSQLDSQLGSQLRSQLNSQLDSQLNSQLITDKKIFKLNSSYLFTLNVYSNIYYTWFKFIKEEFNIKLTSNIEKDFEECFKLQKESGIYSCIFSKEVVVLCKYPKLIHQERSNNFNLHSTLESAVKWGSLTGINFECNYVNGRFIEEKIFKKVLSKSFTFNEFINITNEDIKAGIITIMKEQFGNEYLLKFLGAVQVDKKTIKHTDDYSETLTLYKTKIKYSFLTDSKGNTNVPYAWIEMICPSTGQTYLIDTCPTFSDVVQCAKWHRPMNVPLDLIYKWNSAN